jgi:carbamoyl-phosphate synthase large subunit
MSTVNVLVTAASRRVPLVAAFRRAIDALGLKGRVLVTDVNPLSPAVQVADEAFRVPLSTESGYLDAILDICDLEDVRLVVPTIDDELPVFSAAFGRFEQRGILVNVSPAFTTALCNDKYATCRHLRSHGIPAAASYLPSNLPPAPAFPLFLKPRGGRGSVGAFRADDRRQLDFFLTYVPDPVIQDYLEGPEFTLDVFCDLSGRLLSVVPRERVVVRAGVIDRGRTVRDPRLIELGRACACALPFRGAVNIQCRVVDGTPIVFEINPRFSGGIPLTIAAGADFPRWLVALALGREIGPALGDFTDDLWMTSFESAFFLQGSALDRLQAPWTLPAAVGET